MKNVFVWTVGDVVSLVVIFVLAVAAIVSIILDAKGKKKK